MPFVNILNHYDAAGREVSSTATDNASGISVNDTVGGYDDQGRPTSQTQITTDAGGEVQSSNTNATTYTPTGNVQSETQAGDVSTVYTYYPTTGFGSGGAPDALESVKVERMGTPIIVLSDTEYTYDPVTKRIATVTVNGQTFGYGYKNDTNLVDSVSDGAVQTSFGYQTDNNDLASITTSSEGLNLYSAGYTYNSDQQRQTESVTQENPDGTTSSHGWTFGYDAAQELNSVTNTADNSSVFSATYDGAGNRNDSAFASTYGAANGMNQYAGLTYNARGDLTDDGTTHYTWDAMDELVAETPDHPTTGSTEQEFQYDASQRRTEEDIFNYNGTTGQWDAEADKVLKFAYQGSNLVAEFDGANNLITSLTYGAGTSLVAVTDYTGTSPKTYQVIQDGSGNTVALVDPTNGAVAASYRYAPFGQILSATGPAVNVCPVLWGGMIYDGSAALPYYAWHRYYSPQLDKWISPDPIAEAGGLDTREYANNDPINGYDPTGLYDESGHFWTTYIVAVAAGKSKSEAYTLAYYSQLPDQVADFDASANFIKYEKNIQISANTYSVPTPQMNADEAWAKDVYNWQHSLHGGDAQDVEKRRTVLKGLVANGKLPTWQVGIIIHAYGDAYAHVKDDGTAYGWPDGHLFDGHAPDKIATNVPKYEAYVENLYAALGGVGDPKKNFIIASLFQYVPKLSHDAKPAIAQMVHFAQTQLGDKNYDFAYTPSSGVDSAQFTPTRAQIAGVWGLISAADRATPKPPAPWKPPLDYSKSNNGFQPLPLAPGQPDDRFEGIAPF